MKINNEAVILCGGKGTRLAAVVPDRQKALAEVRGVPVLDSIIEGLLAQGFGRIILATGVRSDQVREYAKKFAGRADCEIVISEEVSPLGTGGAIRNAVPYVRAPHFLAINGDMLIRGIDFKDALEYHGAKQADVTLVAVRPRTEADYGVIEIAPDGRASFREKEGVGAFMSAGAYWMNRDVVAGFVEGSLSIEKEVFPHLAASGRLYGYRSNGAIHDIGTPERYQSANEGADFV